MDLEPRIKLVIGRGSFKHVYCLELDHDRRLLFVVDGLSSCIMVYSPDDGEFRFKIGGRGKRRGRFHYPSQVCIDEKRARMIVCDTYNHRLQVLTLDGTFVMEFGKEGQQFGEFYYPSAVAIDRKRDQLIVCDGNNDRVLVLSAIDCSFVSQLCDRTLVSFPQDVAFDHRLDRIIVCDTSNARVLVWSAVDHTLLFSIDGLRVPRGVCVDNLSRIIVSELIDPKLLAYTHEGHLISTFDVQGSMAERGPVAFDEHRGHIAFATEDAVYVIGANQWLPGTYAWHSDRHCHAPKPIKQAVMTMTMIRSLIEHAPLSLLPNELLFEIFAYL